MRLYNSASEPGLGLGNWPSIDFLWHWPVNWPVNWRVNWPFIKKYMLKKQKKKSENYCHFVYILLTMRISFSDYYIFEFKWLKNFISNTISTLFSFAITFLQVSETIFFCNLSDDQSFEQCDHRHTVFYKTCKWILFFGVLLHFQQYKNNSNTNFSPSNLI